MRTLHPRRYERVLGALITGRVGHLGAGLIDWLVLLGVLSRRRLVRVRASGRAAWGRRS